MRLPKFVSVMVSVSMMVLGAGVVSGQQGYPSKPIRIVTATPGTSTDVVARLIAASLADSLGQPMIVDNRGALVAIEIAAKSPPDGHTLIVVGTNFWVRPLLEKASYDPVKDFAPITLAASAANVLVVTPSLPVKSVKELIALAVAKPGELNYAGASTGSSTHLAAELFKALAHVNIVRIPYKGDGPGLIDLIGGRVQIMFAGAAAVVPHIKAGRLRAVAIGSAEPSGLAPGVPTVAASGLPGYQAATLIGMFAQVKTSRTIIDRLNQDIVRFLRQTGVKEKFLDSGAEAVGSSPEQFAATIKSEMAKWGKLIKDAGIHAD